MFTVTKKWKLKLGKVFSHIASENQKPWFSVSLQLSERTSCTHTWEAAKTGTAPGKAIWPYLPKACEQALPRSTDSHQRVNPGNSQSTAQSVQAGLQSLAWAGAPPDRPHLHPEATWWSAEPVEQQRLMVLVPGSPYTPHALYRCRVKFCYCSKCFYIF